ncbi:isoprenoid synthase domain-containing protein [Ganoderma leucocontextum]|nr:isoprenoid synthase domain-containing protein [Ganoderma leucocontextum]
MWDNVEQVVYIPDTMSAWPWPRKLNPLYEEVEAESIAWLTSFNPYNPESQQAHNKGDFGRLAALVYGDAPRERLRVGTDLVHLLFVIDEYTDMEPTAGVKEISDIVLDALHNTDKPRPEGELVIGKIARDFWARGRAIATPQTEKHFLGAMADYLRGVAQQADDRTKFAICTVDAYMEARRKDSAMHACFMPGELHLSIPDEAFYHPVVKDLQNASTDLVVLDNDIASYNREQATGYEKWNILSVVMNQFGLDLYHATEWVTQYHKEVQTRFLDALTCLPSFGPEVDLALQEYVNRSLAAWPRGNDCWRFESERYFGTKGAEVQKTRRTPLLAKRPMNPEMRRERVQVQLIEELEQVSFAASAAA